MSPINNLAVITGAAYIREGRPLSASRLSVTSAPAAPRDLPALALVASLHILALGALLYTAQQSAPPPVLSFTVTMMDVASSQNSISSAASAERAPAEKSDAKKNVAELTPDARAAKVKKQVKKTVAPTPQTNAPLSHSAQEQTAVLASVTPALFDAAYLSNPAPVYPPLARRMGEQGNVLLSVYVDENGQPQTVDLKKSSGYTRLDSAAKEAVRKWRFAAARQGEKMIASWVQVPVKFVLE